MHGVGPSETEKIYFTVLSVQLLCLILGFKKFGAG